MYWVFCAVRRTRGDGKADMMGRIDGISKGWLGILDHSAPQRHVWGYSRNILAPVDEGVWY